MTSTAGPGRPRRWTAGPAWALWLANLLCLAAVPWLDGSPAPGRPGRPGPVRPPERRRSGPDRGELGHGRGGRGRPPPGASGGLAAVGHRPVADRHRRDRPVLRVRAAGPPGALPAARSAVLYQPATTFTALTLIGFVLLLTPTGALPSARWRWPARVMAATPVVLVLVVTLAGGPVDPRYQARRPLRPPWPRRGPAGGQLDGPGGHRRGPGGRGCRRWWGRFRHARGVERLQLRWVALAAVLVVLGAVGVLVSLAVGGTAAGTLFDLACRLLSAGGSAGGHRGGGAALSAV